MERYVNWDNLVYYDTKVKKFIQDKLTPCFKFGGACLFVELPLPDEEEYNCVYQVIDSFISNDLFEYPDKSYAAGTLIYVTKIDDVYKFKILVEVLSKDIDSIKSAIESLQKNVDSHTDAIDKKVDKVEGKGLSTNDYDDTAVAEVAKIKDKADTATVTALAEQVATKTNVTVNGEHVDEFDADTKLDKIDTLKQAVYVYDANGVNKTVKYTGTEYADYTFVLRSVNGRVLVGTPSAEHDATTKLYVDDADNTKLDKAGGSITGDLAVQGDLTVSGTTTTEHQKQLLVEDNVIVTNANKVDLQSLLSGIAINKNPDATYGIMYDPSDDTVKFGAGTLDENNKFVFNTDEGLPIAIRAQSSDFKDTHLVKWDATKNAFVDSDYTGADIASKTDVTVNGKHVNTFNADTKLDKVSGSKYAYGIYGLSSSGTLQTIYKLSYVPNAGALATYDKDSLKADNPVANAYLTSQTPVRNYHVATKKYVDDQVSAKTSVTVGGANVATFDADTKLDKVSGSDNAYKIYGTDNNGNNIRWNLTYFPQVGGGTIPAFNSNRTITVDPAYNFSALKDSDAINKKYVDNTISSATSITILEASDA